MKDATFLMMGIDKMCFECCKEENKKWKMFDGVRWHHVMGYM